MSTQKPHFEKGFIKDLIARNQIEIVIDSLLKLAKKIPTKDLSNSIIILSSKYENYVKDTRNGVLSAEEQEVSLSKLNQSILDLIDDIPEDVFSLSNDDKKEEIVDRNESGDKEVDKIMRYMILALFGFGFLGVVFSIILLIFTFYPAQTPEFRITHLIPFIGSITILCTAGFFYTINKQK